VRILIAYGSSRGGTAGLAEMLAEAILSHALEVAIGNAAEIEDLTGYDAVVVGGALYNNRWHPDATDFAHRFAGTLQQLPVWFFSSGPLDDSARSGAVAPVPQVRDLARTLDIRGHMTFGGVLAKPAGGRLGALLAYGDAGDWRDASQVAQWAERIVSKLGEPPPAIVLPESGEAVEAEVAEADATRLDRIRRLLSAEEVEDDAGLDVLL